MRPIDADVLTKIIDKAITNNDNDLTVRVLTIFNNEILAAMPTICDLNAAQKEIEEKIRKCDHEMMIALNDDDIHSGHIYDEYHNKKKAYEDALGIIKKRSFS